MTTPTDNRDLWELIHNSDDMTEQDAYILTEMLTACIFSGEKSASMFVADDNTKDIPTGVYSVFFLERRNAIVGYIYAEPYKVVVAQFKDWIAEGIDEDGTLNGQQTSLPFLPIMSDRPMTDEEQADAFAAKAQEIQDDEWAMAFDALLAEESARSEG